eukprot:TRINITY_DN3092_c0_g1_i1.p1 TRINITY_DN3092_c0_g1~~TRINITY_DN3092_c0_g1_i1.p1  ORF type:complete len:110 (-),score=26.91 TRINITY_DN3092_c0_g1_i1:124-453(-)
MALKAYLRAVESAPDSELEKSVIYANCAACHMQLQEFPEVLKYANKALEINPQNVKALLRRGLAYEAMEKYQLALDDMKKALALDPTFIMASQAVGRLDKAVKQLSAYN